MPVPRVLVAVLNWNQARETVACVEAVRGSVGVDLDVVLLDNGSAGEHRAVLQERLPRETLVALGSNRGYTGGMNAALDYWREHDTADYLLLLTPDARPTRTAVAHLVQALDAHPNAVAAGPLIFFRRSDPPLLGAGGTIDVRRKRAEFRRSMPDSTVQEVDWIDGCCMLLRPRVAHELDGFDDRFFAYYEEIDFCARARQAGWAVLLVPEAEADHPKDGGTQPPYYYYYMTRNRLLFWQKNFDVRAGPVLGVVGGNLLGEMRSYAEALIRSGRREERSGARERLVRHVVGAWRGARDHLLGRYGPYQS